jgi:hypothetical protein
MTAERRNSVCDSPLSAELAVIARLNAMTPERRNSVCDSPLSR